MGGRLTPAWKLIDPFAGMDDARLYTKSVKIISGKSVRALTVAA
jgi:hypothetical protein